jgi:hypothetical protein
MSLGLERFSNFKVSQTIYDSIDIKNSKIYICVAVEAKMVENDKQQIKLQPESIHIVYNKTIKNGGMKQTSFNEFVANSDMWEISTDPFILNYIEDKTKLNTKQMDQVYENNMFIEANTHYIVYIKYDIIKCDTNNIYEIRLIPHNANATDTDVCNDKNVSYDINDSHIQITNRFPNI